MGLGMSGVRESGRDDKVSRRVKNNDFFKKNLILGIQSDLKEAMG